MKRMIFVALTLALVSGSAFAAKKYHAQGCGLGSMIFTEDSLVHNVLGATTNATSGNQTFGMSTGTLGCETADVKKLSSQEVFIEANRVALANDIARGNGETLAGLSEMYGCNVNKMGPVLQKNYKDIFPTAQVPAAQINNTINKIVGEKKACI